MSTATLAVWCKKGIVVPVGGADQGQGVFRRFTPMQVLGLSVALEIYSGETGCAYSYVKKIIDAFSRMSEHRLLESFAKGDKYFCMVHQDRPLLGGRKYAWPDVKRLYDALQIKIDEVKSRPRQSKIGHRGLGRPTVIS
jgi:hypothetical protein